MHIAVFGLRNVGKSTLVNALTGQDLSIVNGKLGTTTDPVSKAMEILPLGPCLVTDTAGLDDDEGELGSQRDRKTYDVLKTTDIAVWVSAPGADDGLCRLRFAKECELRNVRVLDYRRGDSVEELKRQLAASGVGGDAPHPLVADLVMPGGFVVCVCPIDSTAPKGRLILPQQQVVREILDARSTAVVSRETELEGTLSRLPRVQMVITDSQAFGIVSRVVPKHIPLTSFSIVFARAKGDLGEFCRGVERMKDLKDGDCVLISEGCTHHRQCDDIGTVKLPGWMRSFTGRALRFEWSSGGSFPRDLSKYALVIHCGGCMLTRRAVQERIRACREAHVPIVNYGVAIARCHGIEIESGSVAVKRRN